MIRGVFFDVDFTLICPGPTFSGEGYEAFCAKHAILVDPRRFDQAVAGAASLLEGPEDIPYDAELYVAYTRHIIEQMGGRGGSVDRCAREIYAEWAGNHHFELYDDVAQVLADLADAGVRVGLISNSHRCLASFQEHFDLGPFVTGAVSSSDHGFMKPHASIFQAAMRLVDVAPAESLMVGDNVRQDVEGALRAGMRAVLLHRGDGPHVKTPALAAIGVPTIRSLAELPAIVAAISAPPQPQF
jgi:putative hydrolase of the HAD superfamily